MSNFERDVANAMLDKADERIRELETELAISKGREEGKQLVIDQLEAERDELALDTTKSDAEAYEKRICELEAALKEAELQRDSWKCIAESGLGIPQAETKGDAP
jgi:hypothetical protein